MHLDCRIPYYHTSKLSYYLLLEAAEFGVRVLPARSNMDMKYVS